MFVVYLFLFDSCSNNRYDIFIDITYYKKMYLVRDTVKSRCRGDKNVSTELSYNGKR